MTHPPSLYSHVFERRGLYSSGEDVQTSYDDAMRYLDGYADCFLRDGGVYVTTWVRTYNADGTERCYGVNLLDELGGWLIAAREEEEEESRLLAWHLDKVL